MQTTTYATRRAAADTPIDQAALPRVFRTPSEHLHPAQIDYASFGNNEVLQGASQALSFAQDKLAAIDELRANPHPEDKPATHARKVREALDNFNGVWTRKWDDDKAALQGELKRVVSDLNQKATLTPKERHFDAITSTFYHMKPNERAEAIADLITQRDFSTLATLIDAPLLVTKLSPEQREGIKERVFYEVDPRGVALRNQIEIALERWENAGFASIRISMRLAEGTDRFNARTKSAEAVANNVSRNAR